MASFALEHLTFSYPGQTRPALDDLTLTIPEGAVTVLCGESGSGKSTLLRQLKTCLTPHGETGGTVRFGDALLKDIPFAEQARRIGFVLQHPDDQIVTDKVFHELAFGLESLGCDETAMRLRVAEMASYFGIADWFERDVQTLSGGQKQMLNLASVVVMRPDVLILDEPTSQLDPIAASTFLHTLRKLNEELGLTILLSEQRLEEAVPLADHLIVLERGRLLASGAPQEAAAAVRGHAIFSAMPTAARIAAALGAPEHLPLTVREGRAYLRRYAQHPLQETKSAPAQAQPVLRVRDGWFRYAQNAPDVLRNFSLTLRPGELYALTGSNGSGKTTALGVLAGQLRLYRGSVYLDGKKQRALQPLRDGIAAVPQDPRALFTADTVRADLASLGRDAALLDTVVQQMALAPLLERHPFDLSGGEQQRAALAKVLLMQPRVLLLDEPTKGMDGAFKAEFGALLRTLCAQGTAVCIVSHDVEFCAQYADRCGLLFRGEVVTENDPRTFFSGNYFYTTAAARIARTAAPGAVLCEESRRLTRRTWVTLGILLLAIPALMAVFVCVWDERKYYLTSLLLVGLMFVPFVLRFEGRRPQARELVLLSTMTALAVAGRAAFYWLPQCKPVCAIVILTAVAFTPEAGFVTGAAAGLISNFFFGQGPWTPWQMLGFGLVGFVGGVLFSGRRVRLVPLLIYGFLSVFVLYGVLLDTASMLMYNAAPSWQLWLATCASGVVFNLIHACSTAVFLLVLYKPLLSKLARVKEKYGLLE